MKISPCARMSLLVRLAIAVLATSWGLPSTHAQNRVLAKAAWEEIVVNLAGNGSTGFEYLPTNEYPVLVALFKEWDALPQVSLDEVEDYWKKHGPKDRDLTSADIVYIRRIAKRGAFMIKNRESIEHLEKAAGDNLFKDLVALGIVDRKAPATFVFIPLPCPSPEVYQEATDFMKAAAEVALEKKLAIVIVRSYYGNENSVRDLKKGGGSWNDEILKLPEQYAKYVEAGVLKFSDRFPGGTPTPWGFLFRGGEYIAAGNVARWGERPTEMLKEFRK